MTFYFTSELVICFRIVLFLDPIFDWSDVNYVVILISMPSYLYLLVGLSQVVLTLESIIKYRNFKLREESNITECEMKRKIETNQTILSVIYIFLFVFMASIMLFFISVAIVYQHDKLELSGTYFGPLELAISNIFVWILLILATCSFVSMLNKRFGEAEFTGPKRKLIIYLCVFSLSFFVRGSYDLVIYFWKIDWKS